MKPLASREIFGTWASLLLPINEDESIDFDRLVQEIEILLTTGVQGVYSNGTAGEFYAQTELEFDRINGLLAEYCEKAGMPFQIGVSHMSPQVSLSRLKRAVQLRPSAVQVILPDWYPLTDEEAICFLDRMGEAADSIGLVLYNPRHAKRVLEPVSYGKLCAAIPTLVGIKVVDGDREWYEAMRQHAPNLSIFVPGHRLASGLGFGAAGSYSNVALLQPVGANRWYELMQTDIVAALEIERKVQTFLTDYLPAGYSNPARDKLLAAIGGWSNVGTRLRWPYR